MTVKVYTSLDDIPAAGRERLSYGGQRDLFASLEWFTCLARHALEKCERIRIYAVGESEPRLWLFCRHGSESRRLEGLSTFYTMNFGPVFTGEADKRAPLIGELIAHIAAERPRWRSLDLRLLREEEPDAGILMAALKCHGFPAARYFQYENYYAPVRGLSFADYYASRSSRTLNTIRRKEKKLKKEHAVVSRIARDYDATVIEGYNAVYGKSWKNAEQFPDFIPALCRMAADLGLLRMGLLTVDGKPAAAQLWLLSGARAVIYKLAYDEDFKEHSVGSILTRDMMEHVLSNDSVTEFDYGVGSEPYKKEWMEDARRLIGVEAVNLHTLSGLAAAVKRSLGASLKGLSRRGAP